MQPGMSHSGEPGRQLGWGAGDLSPGASEFLLFQPQGAERGGQSGRGKFGVG